MSKIFIMFFSVFLGSFNLMAEDKLSKRKSKSTNEVKIYEYTEKINIELSKLKELKPEDYIQFIHGIRSNLKSYFEHKKRVCQGEFSALILRGQKGIVSTRKARKKVRLSKKERTLCYKEMKNMQESYIRGSYLARMRFLETLHQKKISELKKLRDSSLLSLNKSFN